MVVGVSHRLVILPLLFLAPVLMGVDERRVIVFVLVVVGLVLEFAQRAARVAMRDVPVIVSVHGRLVRVFVLRVSHDALSSGLLLHCAPPRRTSS